MESIFPKEKWFHYRPMLGITVGVSCGVLFGSILPLSLAYTLLFAALGFSVLLFFAQKPLLAIPLLCAALSLARVLWLPMDLFDPYGGAAYTLFRPARELFAAALDTLFGTESALARGILLGDTSQIDRGLMLSLQNSGQAHILSVSGLHIGIFALVTNRPTKPLPPWPRLLVRFAVVLFYVAVSGFAAPALRAAWMLFAFWIAAPLAGRADAPSALLFSFAGTLFVQPLSWATVSFQLSFACMLGLVLLEPPLRRLLRFPDKAVYRLFSSTLAAQLAVLPLGAYYFGGFSWISFFLSPLLIPLCPFIVIPGVLAMLVYPFWQSLAYVLHLPARAGLWGLQQLFLLMDTQNISLAHPPVLAICLWLLSMLFFSPLFLPNRKKKPLLGCVIAAASIIVWVAGTFLV